MPGRVVLQDFTGVPCVVDLAAMRDAMKRLGGDPSEINPPVPCDLVIDHSVQVDEFGTRQAFLYNAKLEFERNSERYRFLKWGQQSLSNFRVVPPATGIVHQVNLEYLAKCVLLSAGRLPPKTATAVDPAPVKAEEPSIAYPDSLVGTDSHTTMINGLGVVGWGVGGIEAEAVMLGQPVYMLTPEVVGFRLTGKLSEGTTATDLVLTVTEMLRALGVVEKFVEFCGPGVAGLSIPDRATIANMAPEYGATMGFFPIDQRTLDYLRFTGRDEQTVALAEAYCKENSLFWTPQMPEPRFPSVVELDLSTVQPSLAGPKRPQDRILLSAMKAQWRKDLVDTFAKKAAGESVNLNTFVGEGGQTSGAQVNPEEAAQGSESVEGVRVQLSEAAHPPDGQTEVTLADGSVVIAAITSCTNTSNPDVMLAAGLVAKKANEKGLKRKPWVKTSLAPGSKVVTEYLDRAGVTDDLEALGFHTVGYGCTTCIGNSGPLPPEIDEAIRRGNLVAASVLSGNRNFEGRVHPSVRANYLASPPLVVTYALTGTVDVDFASEPIGRGIDGQDVYLRDIWPTQEEVASARDANVTPEQFKSRYADVFSGDETWQAVPVSRSELYPWDEKSTYIQNPPFFESMTVETPGVQPVHGARVLCYFGDSVTTDHISPAGNIAENSAAGQYLLSLGVKKSDFNSYGSRRGNDRVMTRGTFANVRVRNRLAIENPGAAITVAKYREGGWTRDFTRIGADEEPWTAPITFIYDAAMSYKQQGTPLVVLAGKDYGMGSSRDWAAKGPFLLGVRAVIAQSFERIHRSNLVFMGVLPLQFEAGQSADSLGLDGTEVIDIELPDPIVPRGPVKVRARRNGHEQQFSVRCRIDTKIEIEYYRNGGILPTVIRKKLQEKGRTL